LIPDCGFRISYDTPLENDTRTRFVKRFGSMQAADPYSHPSLVMRYNDSIVSNESNFTFDAPGTLYLYNNVRGNLANIVSGTSFSPIIGNNCLLVRLTTPVSGANGFFNYETYVTASQLVMGTTYVTGVYQATFTLPSANANFQTKLRASGSVVFDQIWTSFDWTVPYFSGSLTVNPVETSTGPDTPKRYYLNVTNISSEYLHSDTARLKVFIFDYSQPVMTLVRVPLETPSVVVTSAYYSIRDVMTDYVAIPFDTEYGSTQMSADGTTMYFDLWMCSLVPGRSYTVDIMLVEGGTKQIYRDVSPAFSVTDM
jgi:hypothetical protein